MNQDQFLRELHEALERPEEWELSHEFLRHEKTGVYVNRIALYRFATGTVYVYAPDGTALVSVECKKLRACAQACAAASRRKREESEQSARQQFLNRFRGFC